MYKQPKIIGVLNITPDSFSDGGKFLRVKEALCQVEKMIDAGVDVIDIGAESTKPGAKSNIKNYSQSKDFKKTELLSGDIEWERLKDILPEIRKIIEGTKIKLSLDTRHCQTLQKCVDVGIDWINDVSGYNNLEITKIALKYDLDFVLMHSLGIPPMPSNVIPPELDPIELVKSWLKSKIECLEVNGVKKEKIIVDPGIGFGKTAEQCLDLVKKADAFKELGCRILYGHSRKLFFNMFTDKSFATRDIESYACSIYLGSRGIDYIRVHDVEGNIRSLRVASAVFGE